MVVDVCFLGNEDMRYPAPANYYAVASKHNLRKLTAGESISARDIVFMHTDGKMYLANAGTAAEAKGWLWFALSDASANNTFIGMLEGEYRFYAGSGYWSTLNEGLPLYLAKVDGEFTVTEPSTSSDYIRVCGYGATTQSIYFNGKNMAWYIVP